MIIIKSYLLLLCLIIIIVFVYMKQYFFTKENMMCQNSNGIFNYIIHFKFN